MKKLAALLCLAGVMTLPNLAQARPVTLTTQLKNYGGDGAYLAIYVTDTNGLYKKRSGFPEKNPSTTNICVTGPVAVA